MQLHRSPIGIITLLCVTLFLLAACGERGQEEAGSTAPGNGARTEAITESDAWLAEKLYEAQDCQLCHGASREGSELGPALNALKPYWNADKLADYLADPNTFRTSNSDFEDRRDQNYSMAMPAFGSLPEEELLLLAGWLLEQN